MKQNRNAYLDLFRFLLAFFVVCIHIYDDAHPNFPLFRLAVPMFFLISGYFSYTTKEDKAKRALISAGRTFRYLAFGFLFYAIFDFVMCYVKGNGVGYYFTTLFYENFIFEFVFQNKPIGYTGAQLWFLIALFIVSLVHYLLVRFEKTKWYRIIVPCTFLIYFFFAGYMYLFQNTDMPIRYTRNAWFFGLPCFGLGYLLGGKNFHRKRWYKFVYLPLAVVFFFLQIWEHQLLETPNISLEMYTTGVISAVFFLLFFLGIEKSDCSFFYRWIGKNASFYIYILHLAVMVVQQMLYPIGEPFTRALVVFFSSFVLYESVFLLSKVVKPYLKKLKQDKNA